MVKVWLYLTINRCHQFSLASVVAEFAKVDALPSAEIQSMVRDGNGERNTHERRFGMSRHVVIPFERVLVVGLVFGYQMVENPFHVVSHTGIGILVDTQTTTGMLHEQV